MYDSSGTTYGYDGVGGYGCVDSGCDVLCSDSAVEDVDGAWVRFNLDELGTEYGSGEAGASGEEFAVGADGAGACPLGDGDDCADAETGSCWCGVG